MIDLEDILKDVQRQFQKFGTNETIGLFTVKPASKWIEEAKTRPIPQMLFSELWFEGDLCILFADTNLGKSILAVQIANSITRGEPIPGFRLETIKQKVLYCDFEMSAKQLENRYSKNFTNHHHFDNDLLRVEVDPDANIPDDISFEEYVYSSLEETIITKDAKILIIDNLTYLSNETEKARDALPLMKRLKELKNKYGLSILVLAHTPKRDLSKPITRNDLQGSKMLINFCDSAFSIGECHADKSVRYLKQIKSRNTEIIYDTDNVILCQIEKPGNFLGFEFMGFGKERDYLRQQTDKEREALALQIKGLKEQGKSLREIARELGVTHMRVKRILDGCNKV